MIEIERLSDALGARIHGVDLGAISRMRCSERSTKPWLIIV